MRKFFVNNLEIMDNHIVLSNVKIIHHLKNVLRAEINNEFLLSDNTNEYKVKILEMSNKNIKFEILEKNKIFSSRKISISLFQGLPKNKKLEFIIQKGTEIGIDEFSPFISERTILPKNFDLKKKKDRLIKIAKEAAEQSKRKTLPLINAVIKENEVLEKLKNINFDLIILLYESEKKLTLKDILKKNAVIKKNRIKIAIIIGPEGGFSEKEILNFKGRGAKIVSLGDNILRTESAGLITAAMIKYEFEL
ncbi:MAG: 16S rRNA (uracil(1498)-N(3))-methyltransferase [Clostridiales Family XIII bacterium]|jgi:16S rRNA (uracil1498-N3)-methyltransferase|nr:16S rRNA (uracil(1498)-N(3))-methyltransferase [Clostridiales Family XIII bacterium]